MSLKQLQERAKDLAAKGRQIVDDSDLTPAQKREQLDALDPDIKTTMAAIEDEMFLSEQRKTFTRLDTADVASEPTAHLTIGEQVVNSAAYRSQLEAGFQGRKFQTGPIDVQAATMTQTASPVVQPQVTPGVVDILFRRLTVADLMPQATTNSNVVRSIVETTATNAAAAVAEEGLKPESTVVFDEVDERVGKVATILKASDEMLADLGWVAGYINGRGVLFVRQEEEDQLLNGNGTAPNISGILDRSGLVTNVGGGITALNVYEQITTIRAESFLEPDALVIHPRDWQDLRTAQDANDQFYGGGPFTGPYGNGGIVGDSYWGLRVVPTPAIAEGTALVGAFSTSAQIFRRTGITVDMTNSDGDDFKYNRVAFRFEERLALSVYRPQGFGTVTTAA